MDSESSDQSCDEPLAAKLSALIARSTLCLVVAEAQQKQLAARAETLREQLKIEESNGQARVAFSQQRVDRLKKKISKLVLEDLEPVALAQLEALAKHLDVGAVYRAAGPFGTMRPELLRLLEVTEARLAELSGHLGKLQAVSAINMFYPLDAEARTAVRDVADFFGVALELPGGAAELNHKDFPRAAELAFERLSGAECDLHAVEKRLAERLKHWPPDPLYARIHLIGHRVLHKAVSERLTGCAHALRTRCAAEAMASLSPQLVWSFAAEIAARERREREFLAAAYDEASKDTHLMERAIRIRTVACLGGSSSNPHIHDLVRATLSEMTNPSTDVNTFRAFVGAGRLREVLLALSCPLQPVGRLLVSRGIDLDQLAPGTLDEPAVTLSACGVLCMGGYTDTLIVVQMRDWSAVKISCDMTHNHCFVYNSTLFVAQEGQASLRLAPVDDVFAGRTNLAVFDEFPLAAPWGSRPCLDTAPSGWVVVDNNSTSTEHVLVDLTQSSSHIVTLEHSWYCLGGFTGINAEGRFWVATDGNEGPQNNVFKVDASGSTQVIARGMSWGPTVLPSASRPSDLAAAAVFDHCATFSIGGGKAQLLEPIRPHNQTLVRLYRDVFMCLDVNTKRWVVVRIVVP